MANKSQSITPDQSRKEQGQEQYQQNRQETKINELPDEENKTPGNPSDPQDQPTQVGSKHPHSN